MFFIYLTFLLQVSGTNFTVCVVVEEGYQKTTVKWTKPYPKFYFYHRLRLSPKDISSKYCTKFTAVVIKGNSKWVNRSSILRCFNLGKLCICLFFAFLKFYEFTKIANLLVISCHSLIIGKGSLLICLMQYFIQNIVSVLSQYNIMFKFQSECKLFFQYLDIKPFNIFQIS